MRGLKIAAVSVLATGALFGCSPKAEQQAPGAPPVTVATPLQQKVVDWDEFTGRFEAVESVDVRARVGGYIQAVHFRDGQMVQKGSCCSPWTRGRLRPLWPRPRPRWRRCSRN